MEPCFKPLALAAKRFKPCFKPFPNGLEHVVKRFNVLNDVVKNPALYVAQQAPANGLKHGLHGKRACLDGRCPRGAKLPPGRTGKKSAGHAPAPADAGAPVVFKTFFNGLGNV